MRLGLTYNLKPPGAACDEYEEFDSVETIEALEHAIRAAGHEPVRLGWGAELLNLPDVDGVFNIAEGVGGRGRESQVPALLELLGIPCTGSSPLAIGLTLDKALAKMVAAAAGIPTAPWEVAAAPHPPSAPSPRSRGEGPPPERPSPACGEGGRRPGEGQLRYPLFVKPAAEGSSMGITESSLCHTREELDAALPQLAKYGPVLVEEYLPGDEFTVGMVDGEVLAVMHVVPRTPEEHFVYSLEVKRDYVNRVEYRLVDREDVADVARKVWDAFELRDVARIDIREDRNGVPNFVEVNPLPGVHPVNSDLVIMAKAAGWTHEQLIGRVIAAAERRWRA